MTPHQAGPVERDIPGYDDRLLGRQHAILGEGAQKHQMGEIFAGR
jgi:hypothetical protein